jgi:hypothetical protein
MVHFVVKVAYRTAQAAQILVAAGLIVFLPAISTPYPGVTPFLRRFRHDFIFCTFSHDRIPPFSTFIITRMAMQ